jgi:PAS domain S-box-containing protein
MSVSRKRKAASRLPKPGLPTPPAGPPGHSDEAGWTGEERRSDALLFDIAARFIALPADRIADEILRAQREVCEGLGLDTSSLWEMPLDEPTKVLSTHIYVPPDYPVPLETMDAKEFFPWTMRRLARGETVVLERLSDIPPEGARDLETFRYHQVQSTLVFPLAAGEGPMFGVVSFDTIRKPKTWSRSLVHKLGLVAQIFGYALLRKRADQELRKSEARYRGLFEDSLEGIFRTSPEGRILLVNPALAGMLGYDSPEDVLQSVRDLGGQVWADSEERSRLIHRLEKEGSLRSYECRLKQKDGTPIWISLSVRPVRGPDGRIAYFDGFAENIEERKSAEQALAELRLERAHLLRVLTADELSTSLAHEINQPLGAILNNAEAARALLSRGPDKAGAIPEIVEDIIQDAQRAGDIIRKVRRVMKKSDGTYERLPVNGLIEETLGIMQNNLMLNNVTLRTELAPDVADIKGDRVRLQQVLLNLVTNALEAMKESPSKVLTLRSAMDGPDTVIVSVEDSGPGVAATHQEGVFQPFFTTKRGGLGLGLSICRSIVEEHEGRIWLVNDPGKGAIFSCSLKAWRGEPA